MVKSVVEAHPQLYHYTTAAGLEGIVRTQQFRATNIYYRHDTEEYIGFFKRRLPCLLDEAMRNVNSSAGFDVEEYKSFVCNNIRPFPDEREVWDRRIDQLAMSSKPSGEKR